MEDSAENRGDRAACFASASERFDLDPPLDPNCRREPDLRSLPPNDQKRDILSQVKSLAQNLRVGPTKDGFDRDAAWYWLQGEVKPRDPKPVMAFMAWCWQDGVRDLEVIKGFVRTWRDKRVTVPYAYFSKTGPARATRVDEKSITDAEVDQRARMNDERRWLNGTE